MCVSNTKTFLAAFLICFLFGLVSVPVAEAGVSIIDPATITEVNPSGYGTYVAWDDSRDIGDKYWNDRNETIGQQGRITDAYTGKTMLGLEGLLLNNGAKNTKGNGPGQDYELKFTINSAFTGKARVYVMIGIRDVFAAAPDSWLKGRLDDNSYSPQMDTGTRTHADRTWIGLDAYGAPIGPVFNRILRRPAPDGRPMAFPCRNGVGEEYFAFYHDFNPGDPVGIYGCYSGGSNYYIFAEPAPPPPDPDIWTNADVGSTPAGDGVYDAATATWDVYGDGADIWGSADAFHYVYTQHSGDFLIQARYNRLQHVENDWGKIGLMVRKSTDAGSQHASLFVRAANDYFGIQFRESAGGGSGGAGDQWPGAPIMPRWFRLKRAGNTFTGSSSPNGVTWTDFASRDLTIADPVLVGMAVTSHVGNRITSASYSFTYVSGKGMVFSHPGVDQSVDQLAADATFVLDGSGSLADNPLQYSWTQTGGTPLFTIPDPTLPTIILDGKSVDIFGDTAFTFRLTITDTVTLVSQDSYVHIFVKDKEQAHAGPDQTNVGEGVRVDFDGTATTGTITKWEWTQIGGPPVPVFFGVDTATPFIYTDDYVGDQVLTFQLSINDGEGIDTISVFVPDAQQAVANAGADFAGWEMRTLTLDARGSTTRDGTPWDDPGMSYSWTKTGGPDIYKFLNTDTATPTFIAPEIPLTQWPPTRTLTFRVTVTGPNGSTATDDVTVTVKDAEFETVFYREHEDFDFHNSLDAQGRWYPTEAQYGVHYCWGTVAIEAGWYTGMLDPNVDYQWSGWGGDHSYRDGVSLGTGGTVPGTCGTDWKCGWIAGWAEPGDFWKFTFDIPYGSDHAYIVNWMATDDSWNGNARAFYDYEWGNTSPVAYFRVMGPDWRNWDQYAPLISPPFAVNPGLHRIMIQAYGGGQPNFARFELRIPQNWANIANAGPDKGAVSGELVTLDGKATQETNTTYTWEQVYPDSPVITLTEVGKGVASFVAPATAGEDFIFRLRVSGPDNDSVDFVHVTVIPADTVYALFANQRTGRDPTPINWGADIASVTAGAEFGNTMTANTWGALPPLPSLSGNPVVHYNVDTDVAINNNCWSEFTFNLPAGSAGDYYFYMRAAYKDGDSAYVRPNEGIMGIWPTDTPPDDHHRIADDNGYRGQMDWNWAAVLADTVPLLDGQNVVRLYGRESHVNEWRPFTWDVIMFSKVALDRGNLELMDKVALAARIGAGLTPNAGADFTLYAGETGVLDGTGSLGLITSGIWEQTGGPAVPGLTAVDPLLATFVAPAVAAPQVATFKLTIGDGTSTASDTVNVTILQAAAPPAMPTNLVAEPVEMGVRLTWDPVPGAVTYKILRREAWKWWPFDTAVAEGLSETTWIDRDIPVYMDELWDYTVIAVNAFGDSIPAHPAEDTYALSANLALRPDADPFAKKPHPGWTLGTLMNNRYREENFDSWYNCQASADDWWGYFWSEPLGFQEIHYYPGGVFGDGGFWTSLGVQFTKDGVYWYDVPGVTITPPYDFTDSPAGRAPWNGALPYVRRHILKFPRVEGIGLRIYGAPGGSCDFTSAAEIEVYGVQGADQYLYAYAGPDFSVNENTTATLDGSDSSTLAVRYHWEQITGEGAAVTSVDMSSAFNTDVIWAPGEDLAAQDAFDPGGPWVYTSNPSVGAGVLPADGKVGEFQLGPYAGNNCLLLSAGQTSGVVDVPDGSYGYASFVIAAANGGQRANFVLNYSDGNSAVMPFGVPDWFGANLPRVVSKSWRVRTTDGATHHNDGPNLMYRTHAVDPARTLVSITFQDFAGTGNQTAGIFAVNLSERTPMTQVDMSSAFNADVVWEKGEDIATQDAYELGGDNWLYTSNTDVGPYVLPAGGVVNGYQLGPYTADNCLLLSDQQRSGYVPVPAGNYGSAGIVMAGASGNHWINLIFHYTNGDSAPTPFLVDDWFFRPQHRVVDKTYRVSRGNPSNVQRNDDPGNGGGPNLYDRIVAVDPNRTLTGITFAGFTGGGSQTAGIWAINLGPPVPFLQLVNADSPVCTFTVPEITKDQTVTFRLTVWDAADQWVTDDVDVTLVDTGESRADAGTDIVAQPFWNATLDGSATGGDIVWWKWEHIGGTPPVAIWNADQAQATIIVPAVGSWSYFKLTAGAANGTVSSDTVTVSSQYGLPLGLPSVPSSGFIQDVLMCGANYTSRFTSNLDVNYDHLASNGGQANQNPSAGDAINIGGESFADGPAVWTPLHQDDGWWFHDMADNYVSYFHVYIISPDQRAARCRFRHDDEMRGWNNGSLAIQRDGWDGGSEQAYDFTLFEGINSMTFKIHEGGGGDELAIRFTDRSDAQYTDLQYALSYSDLLPQVRAITYPDPPEALVVEAGDLLWLDGRGSTSGVNYSWEQVWPTEPEYAFWFADSDEWGEVAMVPILGAPLVENDTDFFIRLWADDDVNYDADVVKVTVATKNIPGPVSGLSGEWAGDVGAVLRWNDAEFASRYNILRAEDPAGPFANVGTAYTNAFVDVGPLVTTTTYTYRVEPANILNVGPGYGQVNVSYNPKTNITKSDLVVPIVGQPNPLGGGSRDIGLMNDGIVSGQNYDTFDGNTPNPGSLPGEETFEFFGYLFDKPITVHSLVYYTGGVFGDGGWWTLIGVQVTKDGVTWQDASGVVFGPPYNTADSGAGRSWNEKYIIGIVPDAITGIRIAGHAGGSARFVSIAELEVYADIAGLNVNAGPDLAVDEVTAVTLDGSATTGATTYQWECITDPTLPITDADKAVASFTAPGVFFQEALTFRLTASNAVWESSDEATITVMDTDTWHIYRYSADFDGRTGVGGLRWAGNTWQIGHVADDCTRHMEGYPANEAPDEATVTGNDFFFQRTDSPAQTYRVIADGYFDVRYGDFGVCGAEPFVGYTEVGDWFNYTFGQIPKTTINTLFPADGVMFVSVFACTGYDHAAIEIILDNQVVTTIRFPYTAWGNWGWHPAEGSFLVTAGQHTIRVHVIETRGLDFCKFRFDLAVPRIEQVSRTDSQVLVKWNDVGRIYTIQAAAGPGGPWVDIYGPTTETSVISDVPPEKLGFYRIKVE